MAQFPDTIFALSSGGLPSGVAIVRVSGPRAFAVCEELCGQLPGARTAALRALRKNDGQIIDHGLVLLFPGPNSFIGEDCVELQVHGSKAVISALLKEVGEKAGCRIAEAGEFSRRAFENGKLDLVEIEGLADLLAAETEMQRRLAIEHADGQLSRLYEDWKSSLLRARALIEAELDFADEEDIPGSVSDRIWPELMELLTAIDRHIEGQDRGEIIRDGFKVVISGPPNSGKSSLINNLAKRDLAIVTEVAGTTRDIVQCDVDFGGYLVRFYDTAGIRQTDDLVEREGIRRAIEARRTADLVLQLNDCRQPLEAAAKLESQAICYVATKLDIGVNLPSYEGYDIAISTKTGEGLSELRDFIMKTLESKLGEQSFQIPSRLRHVEHLRICRNNVATALETPVWALEIRTEFLRKASDELGKLTGRIDTEMLLGAIFSEFCVGK